MGDIENIKTIAVIGAGTLGHGIAFVALLGGFEKVILSDINEEALEIGAKKIEKEVERLTSEEKFRYMLANYGDAGSYFAGQDLKEILADPNRVGTVASGESVEEIMSRLVKEVNLKKAVENADYIIESVSENMKIKKEVFKKLNEYAPPHAVLATNSSSLSISEIAKDSGRPDKVIGMHFFHPFLMQLIEITRGDQSSVESIEIGAAVGLKLPCITGKRETIKLDKESPGFIANRIQSAGLMYMCKVMDKAKELGVPWERIDADLGVAFPVGACEIIDSIGIDVVYDVQKYLETALSPDFAPGKVLSNFLELGNLGKKTGKGFYEWDEEGKRKDKVDKSSIEPSGLLSLEALLAIQLNEGCRILEEGIVSNYKLVDKAVNKGFNTPGPFLAGKRKYKEYIPLLDKLADETGIEYFRPCELMRSGEFLKMRR